MEIVYCVKTNHSPHIIIELASGVTTAKSNRDLHPSSAPSKGLIYSTCSRAEYSPVSSTDYLTLNMPVIASVREGRSNEAIGTPRDIATWFDEKNQ